MQTHLSLRIATILAISSLAAPLLHAADSSSVPADITPLAPVKVEATEDHDASIGSLDGTPARQNPVSLNTVGRQQLDDMQVHSLIEAVRLDASTGDSYAPVGYYQNISIRGFPLDLATGYRFNGLAMSGQQRMALENKQAVEILKGLAGIEAGVVSPGGLVNFVSKRPEDVRRISLGSDDHGSRRAAIDLGGWVNPDFGLRFNAAWGDELSYVRQADGRRNFYALAADWNISERVTLRLDSDYQTSAQRSVSGYQLLGGTDIPADAHNDWLLGYQPWQLPVSMRTANHSARLDWAFSPRWQLKLAGGFSRSVIDDRVSFAWGCYYTAACADGDYPGNYFGPDGSYDIYDWRSPGDTRRNAEARATLVGQMGTGTVTHVLSLGTDAVRSTVDQRPEVNEYVGSANIDQRLPPVYAPSPLEAGPLARRLDNWQRSLLAQDRIRFGEHWQLLAGLRHVRLDERARDPEGQLQRHTRLTHKLPQAALSWLPNEAVTAWLSYSKGLSLGGEAPFWTSNAGTMLPPMTSRQMEAGLKWQFEQGPAVSASLFRIQRPNQYAQPDDSEAGYSFVQQGQAVHEGLELGLNGQVTGRLRLDASASWIHARLRDTGTRAYEGHQIVNVPRLQLSALADYQLAASPDLALLGGWRHAGARAATDDNRARTAGWNVFDAGLRYRAVWAGHPVTWQLMVSNIGNRFYWRDTGGMLGDRYLFPGEPRELRLSASWDF